jgi:uncharacterized protein
MSYIPAQCRIRVEFTKEDCDESRKPPSDIEERVRTKLDSEISKGNITYYEMHLDLLKKIWTKIRKSKIEDEELIAVTIAMGGPEFPELEISMMKETAAGVIGLLSINATAKVAKSWNLDQFCLFVQRQLKEQKSKKSANPAQLQGLYLRACDGQNIQNAELRSAPAADFRSDEFEDIDLITDPLTHEVMLIIHDVKGIMDRKMVGKVLKAVEFRSEQISVKHDIHFEVLIERIVRRLRSANRGPERYGFELPLVLLAARTSDVAFTTNQKYFKKPKEEVTEKAVVDTDGPSAEVQALKKYVRIGFSEDKLSGFISEWDVAIYDEKIEIDIKIIEELLHELGIRHGIDEDGVKQLLETYEASGEAADTVVATGTAASAGKGPYLYDTYKHRVIAEEDGDTDVRALQQRFTVKKDQIVAEIAYKTDAVEGCTIFGDTIEAPEGAPLEVEVGDGIRPEGLKFIAEHDGIPEVTETAVQMTNDLVHEGNINLASGNIDFDGSVQIVGNIEEGSFVNVNGDLRVMGMIQGGTVKVSGMVTVEGGIMGDDRSIVRCGGDIFAEFFSNATIVGGGGLICPKSLMTCHISVVNSVELTGDEESVIAGGSISSGEDVKAAYLGRGEGSVTHIQAGCDIKNELSFEMRTKRIENINQLLERESTTLKEYKRKRDDQMTEKNEQIKQSLQKRVDACKRIIEEMTKRAEAAKEAIKHNKEAKIMVKEVLSKNVKLVVGGSKVGIPEDIAGVAVTANRIQGSFVVAIEHFDKKSD